MINIIKTNVVPIVSTRKLHRYFKDIKLTYVVAVAWQNEPAQNKIKSNMYENFEYFYVAIFA